jgi:predicted DNA-binding transcriptional regulator AlpA
MTEQIAATIPQAAEMVGLSSDSIRRAIRKGQIVPRYPNGKPLILVADLRAWIESAPTEAPSSLTPTA